MTRHSRPLCAIAAAAAALAIALPSNARAAGAFSPQGEQLDLAPPPGWVLTELRGEAQGNYVLRYEPEASQRAAWKNAFLTIERLRYPDQATIDNIRATQGTVAAQVANFVVGQMGRNCTVAMNLPPRLMFRFGSRSKAVQGAFCSATPVGPFGEAMMVATFEGEGFMFSANLVWQPQSEAERDEAAHKVDDRLGGAFMGLVSAAKLCGNGVPCTTVIAPPRGAAAVAAATDLSGVAPAVQAWASAWSAKDLQRYLDFYAASFQPPSGSLAAWKAQRAARIAKPGAISITVEALQVRADGADGAQATFRQTYRSSDYVDVTQKTLRLVREGQAWKIRAEGASPAR